MSGQWHHVPGHVTMLELKDEYDDSLVVKQYAGPSDSDELWLGVGGEELIFKRPEIESLCAALQQFLRTGKLAKP